MVAAARSKKEEPQTKRSKLNKLQYHSTKNQWPQHPKIRDADQRAKAYVRTAGLVKPKQTADLDTEEDPTTIKLGRLLGGADQRARHAAVLKLRAYLTARCEMDKTGFSEMDLLKLWKGLWFTLYMADKVPVQEELSMHIAKLIWCLKGTEEEDEHAAAAYMELFGDDDDEVEEMSEGNDDDDEDVEENDYEVTMEEVSNTLKTMDRDDSESDNSDGKDEDEDTGENAMEQEEDEDPALVCHCRGAHLASLFLRTFLVTLRREWGNMDKYRIDKFYTLTRFLIRQVYQYMAIRHWNLGIVRLFNDALFEESLTQLPNGIRYHLIDIAMTELATVNATEAPIPLTEATWIDCLEPFLGMLQTCDNATVHTRLVENIMERFLFNFSVLSDKYNADKKGSDEDEEPSMIMDQVHVGTLSKLIFELASDGETKDEHRKRLYDLHKTFERRLKQIGKDVELHRPDEDDDEHEEAIEETDATEDPGETDEPPVVVATTKADKKKKKKKKSKEQHEEGEESGTIPKVDNTPPKDTKKKKKDKAPKLATPDAPSTASTTKDTNKSQSKEQTKSPKDKAAPSDKAAPEPEAKSKKESKKSKKKKRQEPQPEKEEEHEIEIAISVSDQKRALSASKQRKLDAKRKKESKEADMEWERNKRVKFDKHNAARSWKASMKGLRTMENPNGKVSPDKGILMHKDRASPKVVVSNKKKRRKAVDYFK